MFDFTFFFTLFCISLFLFFKTRSKNIFRQSEKLCLKKKKVILFFGAPLSGKGTQSTILASHLRMTALSTGDLFRSIPKEYGIGKEMNEYMKRGELIPNDLTQKAMEEELSKTKYSKGLILDGFPREMDNVDLLNTICLNLGFEILCAINLEVPEEILFERLSVRRQTNPERPDNNEDVYKKRLDVFKQKTLPVIQHYEEKKILVTVDTRGDIYQIADKILRFVSPFIS
jgi:adenylate kinase